MGRQMWQTSLQHHNEMDCLLHHFAWKCSKMLCFVLQNIHCAFIHKWSIIIAKMIEYEFVTLKQVWAGFTCARNIY